MSRNPTLLLLYLLLFVYLSRNPTLLLLYLFNLYICLETLPYFSYTSFNLYICLGTLPYSSHSSTSGRFHRSMGFSGSYCNSYRFKHTVVICTMDEKDEWWMIYNLQFKINYKCIIDKWFIMNNEGRRWKAKEFWYFVFVLNVWIMNF